MNTDNILRLIDNKEDKSEEIISLIQKREGKSFVVISIDRENEVAETLWNNMSHQEIVFFMTAAIQDVIDDLK